MILQYAHSQFFDFDVLKTPKQTSRKRYAVFLMAISFGAQILVMSPAHSSNDVETSSPPTLDVDAASVREKARWELERKEVKASADDPDKIAADQEEKVSVGLKSAEPIQDSSISLAPIINVDPELKDTLNRQFNQIQTLFETEDAFSEKLGENYFNYGKLLLQVARADEAEEAFINALHITKVNNGVESIEQRPVLRELFEISYAKSDLKEADSIAKRIVRLEKHRPDNSDTYSFDILMRLGHLYLDMYLEDPINGEQGLTFINKAMNHFKYVDARYGDKPLSELLMPYGELAFLWYLKNQIRLEINEDLKRGSSVKSMAEIDRSQLVVTPERARRQGLKYLNAYYDKANDENDIESVVRALLNIGDLNLLYGRQADARQFYASAWQRSQALPNEHYLIKSFDGVVKLPNFKYALKKSRKSISKEYDEIPLTLTIDINGRVRKVKEMTIDGGLYKRSIGRAKRTAKKHKFRPILENGKPLKVSTVDYIVKLPARTPRS